MNAVTKFTPAPDGEAVQLTFEDILSSAGDAAARKPTTYLAETGCLPGEGQAFWHAMGSRLIANVRAKITERALLALDDHALKDIGLHRSEIPSAVRHGDRRCGKGPSMRWFPAL